MGYSFSFHQGEWVLENPGSAAKFLELNRDHLYAYLARLLRNNVGQSQSEKLKKMFPHRILCEKHEGEHEPVMVCVHLISDDYKGEVFEFFIEGQTIGLCEHCVVLPNQRLGSVCKSCYEEQSESENRTILKKKLVPSGIGLKVVDRDSLEV